jgi:hypothetical protein
MESETREGLGEGQWESVPAANSMITASYFQSWRKPRQVPTGDRPSSPPTSHTLSTKWTHTKMEKNEEEEGSAPGPAKK